jgi:hypothetical protein
MNKLIFFVLMVLAVLFSSCSDNEICIDTQNQVLISKTGNLRLIYLKDHTHDILYEIQYKSGLKPLNKVKLEFIDSNHFEISSIGVTQKKVSKVHFLPETKWLLENHSIGDAATYGVEFSVTDKGLYQVKDENSCNCYIDCL